MDFVCPTSVFELNYISQNQENIDLIFIDPKTKELDIDSFMKSFKEKFPESKVIYYSSRVSEKHAMQIVMASILSFFPDSFRKDELEEVVQKVLGTSGVESGLVTSEIQDYKGKILLVDKEVNLLLLLGNFLKLAGYMVETLEDGTQLLDRLRTSHLDLVIIDIDLPGINVFDLQKQIKRSFPNTFTVGMSWNYNAVEAQKLIEEGAYTVLKKPFQLHNISRILSKLIFVSVNPMDEENDHKPGNKVVSTLGYVAVSATVALGMIFGLDYLMKPPPEKEKTAQTQPGVNPANIINIMQGAGGANSGDMDQIKKQLKKIQKSVR